MSEVKQARSKEDPSDRIRIDCWDKALDSFGYAYIYDKRLARLGLWLRWSEFFGIVIPILLGGILTTYYSNQGLIDLAIKVTAPIAIAQLIVSAYLTVTGANARLQSYAEKSAEHAVLSSQFEQLAKHPIEDINEYRRQYDILAERERGLAKGTSAIRDKELRMGMRYGLRNYRRKCAGCGEVPVSMESTECDVCGNF